MKLVYLLALIFVLTIVSVSAWPYEFYSNGTLIDLNSSNNETTNLTIYHITNENITEITNENITEVTNNITGSFYNKTEIDNLLNNTYVKIGEQYGNSEVFNRAELNIKLTNLTNTDANLSAQLEEIEDVPLTWLWATILLTLALATIALILVGKGGSIQ